MILLLEAKKKQNFSECCSSTIKIIITPTTIIIIVHRIATTTIAITKKERMMVRPAKEIYHHIKVYLPTRPGEVEVPTKLDLRRHRCHPLTQRLLILLLLLLQEEEKECLPKITIIRVVEVVLNGVYHLTVRMKVILIITATAAAGT